MNNYWLALILGVVEGLTEFIPVSSTAHLRLTQALLGVALEDEYWKMFSIVIQLGAILSLFVIFHARIREFFDFKKGVSLLLQKIILAFVVTAGPAFLLTKVIGKNLESVTVMATALFVGGIVMIGVDKYFRNPKTIDVEQTSWVQSIAIGAGQILSAVFPGTSRSMSTIATGQIMGLSRAAAIEFSFLLSIPTMIVATGYDLLRTLHHSEGGVLVSADQWLILGIGFVVSFFVAWAVVAWFLKYVRNHGFLLFGIYRIVIAVCVYYFMAQHS
jgi:undecaprenyl-diphosphatase